jgi:hypothetical protein
MSGKQALADATRWEQWETSGGLLSLTTQQLKQSPTTAIHRTGSYSSSTSSNLAFGTSPNSYSVPNSYSGWTAQTMPPIITPPAPGKWRLRKFRYERSFTAS